jgi:hypothetical protein
MKRRTQSPPSPTGQALNQLVKGCELAMHSAILLTDEDKRLRIKNHHQKRKKLKKRSYITKGGILTGAEAQVLIENEGVRRTEVVENEPTQVRQRALPKCSLCQSLEHNARTCPKRQETT